MIAVIETGGKQYCIRPGDKIVVERLATAVNQTISFPNLLTDQPITLEVVEHQVGPKIVSRKFRNKTRYHRLKGHRQPVTVLAYTKDDQPTPAPTKKAAQKNDKKAEG